MDTLYYGGEMYWYNVSGQAWWALALSVEPATDLNATPLLTEAHK